VQAGSPFVLPAAGYFDRVICEDSLAAVVTLIKANAASAADVDCRE
jgi:hypothetical protein